MNQMTQWARSGKQRARLVQEAWRLERWCQRARRLERRPAAGGRALILVSGGVGSIGDEAMLLAACHAAKDRGIAHATLVSYGGGEPWPLLPGYDRVLDLSQRFSQAFWSTGHDWLQALQEATHFLIIGADVMDGHYNPYECRRRVVYARMAQAAGVQTTVLGFSFNDSPHPLAVAALDSLPPAVKLYARDPISYQRLGAALARPVDLAADIAFLLQPANRSPLLDAIVPWLQQQRAGGRLTIGINANFLAAPASMRREGGRPLVEAHAAGLAAYAAASPQVAFLLIPHDYRQVAGLPSDQDVAEAIALALPDSVREQTRVVPRPARAPEIKALTAHLDLVLTGRMHLAIAAIGSGTPAGGVVYQDKFEGLYQHLGLPALCLDPQRLAEPGVLAGFLAELARQRSGLADIIATNLPRIRALAAGNLGTSSPASSEDA